MRKAILLLLTLVWAGAAHAQTTGSGTIDGLPYVTLTSPGGCSAAAPCQIVEYLHPLGEQDKAPDQIQRYFNNSAFLAANPHTIVLAPMIPGSSSTNNWGDVQDASVNNNMQAAVDLVKQVKSTVSTTGDTTLVGASMGAIAGPLLLSKFGPKGSQEPGIYQDGLFYDGAPYQVSTAAMTATLCGIPMIIVHGADDTTVSPTPDHNMAQTLSGCSGFQFISVPGIGHGSYSGSAIGLANPDLITQMTTAAAGQGGSTTTAATPPAAVTATAPPAAVTTPQAAAAPAPALTAAQNAQLAQTNEASASETCSAGSSATITPGQGSLTDGSGNIWSINDNTKILMNGIPVIGGGDTSEMTMQDCTVLGHSNGMNGSSTGWFTMNSNDPTASDGWTMSDAPGSVSTAAVPVTTAPQAATPVPPTISAINAVTPSTTDNSCPVDTTGGSGRFHVAGGRLIDPKGKDFIARGINVSDRDMGAANDIIKMFPGINLVRLAIYSYQDPSAYSAFIATMTGHGTVVLIEHHVETNGATGGGGQGGIASGAWLAAENAFYSAMAKANAGNPYVFFGTTNEPPGQSGLSQWQRSTYDAIRGGGNSNPILLEISGWPGNWTNALDPSVYASMTNVVWDPHYYGWVSRYSQDPGTVAAALADIITSIQTITSSDGIIPAMVAEYGPSTTGMSFDANGDETVDAVITRGANNETGSAIWHWGQQDCCNNLGDASGLTNLGQKVQMFIGTDVDQPTQCQLNAAAQQGIANVTAAMGTASK